MKKAVGMFDGMAAFINSMTPKQLKEMADNLDNYTALIASLKNRGIVSTNPSMSEIYILKRHPDTIKLREYVANIKGYKIKILTKKDLTKNTKV